MYEPIWFKLGVTIDTIKPYTLMLVCLTLTMIQGHRIISKSLVDLDEILHAVQICSSN